MAMGLMAMRFMATSCFRRGLVEVAMADVRQRRD
jgi:hypothetical protein